MAKTVEHLLCQPLLLRVPCGSGSVLLRVSYWGLGFSDVSQYFALDSNTTRMLPGFFGWYTPVVDRYQHSSFSSCGGAASACLLSNIYFMNVRNWSFNSGFHSSIFTSEVKRVKTCSWLLERCCRGTLKGRGATQLFNVSLYISLCMISKKVVFSTDDAGLLSRSVRLKTWYPRSPITLVFLSTEHLFSQFHEGYMEGHCLTRLSWMSLQLVCACFPNTSATRTYPKSSFCAKGALWGPLTSWWTLWTLTMSLLSNMSISALGSSPGMHCAMLRRCGWWLAASGVGISERSFNMLLHSISDGRWSLVFPSRDSIWNTSALMPDVSTIPAHFLSE